MRLPNSCSATPRFRMQTCNLLKARVVVRTYNHHVRLLSPEPFGWLVPLKSTRAWEHCYGIITTVIRIVSVATCARLNLHCPKVDTCRRCLHTVVQTFMTDRAQRDQVVLGIVPGSAAEFLMVNLKISKAAASLTSPSVPVQHCPTELLVGFGRKPQTGMFGSDRIHQAR